MQIFKEFDIVLLSTNFMVRLGDSVATFNVISDYKRKRRPDSFTYLHFFGEILT